MACLSRWGASGVHLGADVVMAAGDKRRGGSKATTTTKPQQPKTNNPKSTRGSAQPRPQTR